MSPRSVEFMDQARDRAVIAPDRAEAQEIVEGAADYIAAIEAMLDSQEQASEGDQ